MVITFDDGPLPPYTDIILDTLASQCVKATYFLVGQMARAYPAVVRRIYNEGHTIGTHSQKHPHFERLSMRRVEREVDGGINSVTTALGDAKALSPFFRIPYLGRTNAIERFLEGKQLVTWSADVDTNDWWRGSSPGAIVKRTMRRLNAEGHGIILMHDIHRATAMALPILLKELKANGYNVVHVVAAGERPKSIPELMALPASDGKALPTALTNAPSGDDALTTRQNHRIQEAQGKQASSGAFVVPIGPRHYDQTSVFGLWRILRYFRAMSALHSKADMCGARAHVCFGPKADTKADIRRFGTSAPF